MEEKIVKEVKNELNFRERIVFCMCKKIYLKFYNIIRIKIINSFLNSWILTLLIKAV